MDIEAIIIPTSGSARVDLRRALDARHFNNENCGGKVPYIVSGIGSDINRALGYSQKRGYCARGEIEGLDFHKDLWEYMARNDFGLFGVDINSRNSEEKLTYTFPDPEATGKYAIVSSPFQLRKFRILEEKLKEQGKLSKALEFVYVPTT